MKKYKGQLENFPEEVVEKMLQRQVEQGNPKNVDVFEEHRVSTRNYGGFDWDKTPEKEDFWIGVIMVMDFNVFFQRYPRPQDQSAKLDNNTTIPNGLKIGDRVAVDDYSEHNCINGNYTATGTLVDYIEEFSYPYIVQHDGEVELERWKYAVKAPPEEQPRTLRDEFAMAVMQVLIPSNHGGWDHADIANMAYEYADAMMYERERKG